MTNIIEKEYDKKHSQCNFVLGFVENQGDKGGILGLKERGGGGGVGFLNRVTKGSKGEKAIVYQRNNFAKSTVRINRYTKSLSNISFLLDLRV